MSLDVDRLELLLTLLPARPQVSQQPAALVARAIAEEAPICDRAAAVAKVLAGDNCDAIASIATDGSLSLDEKMRRIAAVNPSAADWRSPKWAELLGLSASRIRQSTTWEKWQEDRKKQDV